MRNYVRTGGDALKLTIAERDSLFDVVKDLEQKVDSLIKSSEATKEQADKAVKETGNKNNSGSATGGKLTASECVDNLVKLLKQLRDASAVSQSETVKQKNKYRDEALDCLKQYVELKGNKLETDNIAILLRWDRLSSVQQDNKSKKFVSTNIVVNKINAAIETAKKLK